MMEFILKLVAFAGMIIAMLAVTRRSNWRVRHIDRERGVVVYVNGWIGSRMILTLFHPTDVEHFRLGDGWPDDARFDLVKKLEMGSTMITFASTPTQTGERQ